MSPLRKLKLAVLRFWRGESSLEYRVALLEAKYDQLAKEVGRIERDLIKIFREIEGLKHGQVHHNG